MQPLIPLFLAVLAVAGAPAAVTAGDMPGADAAALWKHITETAPYAKWSAWPDHQGMKPGRAPHGEKNKVFVNDILLQAQSVPAPYGSIQVKENYDNKEKLQAITVMYKIKGFNPKDGDWFWAKYTPDGKPGPAGKVDGCINCHGSASRNDYIFVHELK